MTSEIEMLKNNDSRVSIPAVRLIARVMGVFLFIVFLVIPTMIHGGRNLMPIIMNGRIRDFVYNYSVLTMLFGLIIAWRNEGFGGVLIIGGWVIIAVLMLVFGGPLRLVLVFGTFLVPGILFIYCWRNTRKAFSKPE